MSEELVAQEKSFAELFEESCEKSLWENKVVKGKIVAVDSNFVTIDVGLKSEGRVALSEFNYNGNVELKAGDEIDVFIDRYEDKSGSIVLSREKALREAAWDDLEKSFKEGENVMGTMFNRVKGGFMVNLGGVTAFLPGSQVDVRPVKDISPLMGVEQPFLILKMDKQRENIVVSRKGVLEGANAEERAKVIEKLEEGQILDGIVKNITSYGAFVDIGGVDGLLHNTDISWKRINHPSEVLTPSPTLRITEFSLRLRKASRDWFTFPRSAGRKTYRRQKLRLPVKRLTSSFLMWMSPRDVWDSGSNSCRTIHGRNWQKDSLSEKCSTVLFPTLLNSDYS